MKRLVIHAGFTKTGSSSIQHAIGSHLEALKEAGFYLFGREMQIAAEGGHPGSPIWFLEDAAEKFPPEKTLLPEIRRGFEEVGEGATLILTSENLSQNKMPRLFSGVDREFSVDR